MPYYFIDHNGEKSLIEKENDKNTIYYYEAPNKEKDYYYEEDG